MLLLIPSDTVSSNKPEEQFAPEAAAARELGIEVALVDHDALCRPGRELDAVRRVPAGEAIYRGWMLSSDRYAAFATAMTARNAMLRTEPSAYRRAHEFPNWYPALEAHTPSSFWTEGPSLEQLVACCARLGRGPAVLRDFVKSAKHDWAEACFIPDVADRAAVERIGRRFQELRDDDFTGGFVVRRFESFQGAEARTWWVGGECRLVTAHPDTPDETPPARLDVSPYSSAVRAIDSPFVTLDLAMNTNGQWRVIELGDGQVSDRPESISASEFLSAIVPPGKGACS